VRGSEITAVLYRHRRLPRAPVVRDPEARQMAESELLALLDGALLSLDVVWVNHPAANQLARHKPLQLRLAHAEGFTLPSTCITDNPVTVRELWREWDGQMIAKLVGGQVAESPGQDPYAVFTTRLEADDLADDAAIAACPAIYQRLIEKEADLRVTVVGRNLFACRIPSQEQAEGSVDWRRAGRAVLPPTPYELDDGTARRCRRLAQRLGLEFAGIDLVLTPAGEIVFLEINATGQWAWIEDATGLPIAAAIAERLLTDGA
jgi:glutathione synthase/RimK-type ligase-like ATP-grasp enzyme